MSLNWRRIALLFGFLATVVLIGYLIYYFFLKPAIPTAPVPINGNTNQSNTGLPTAGSNVNIRTVGNTNGALPGSNTNATTGLSNQPATDQETPSPIANGGLTDTRQLTSSSVLQPTLAANTSDAIYYDRTSGIFYKISPGGTAVPMSNKVFYNVSQVTWAPNKQIAVIQYPDGSNTIYDFTKQKQVTLPNHWKDFSFSPDSSKLVLKSMGIDTENRWLAVSNTDGSQAKKIEPLGDKDQTVQPSWSPNNQMVAMFEEDKSFDQQNLYFVGLNNENFKSMVVEGRGIKTQWSTQGDKLLYSVYSSTNDYKPSLWIAGAQGDNIGENRRNLQINTWANKCSFTDNDTVYCAVPRSLDTGAGIFADQMDTAPTDIYKIDLKTGLKSQVAVPAGNINISSLMVTGDGNYIYFTGKDDGKLYGISLK